MIVAAHHVMTNAFQNAGQFRKGLRTDMLIDKVQETASAFDVPSSFLDDYLDQRHWDLVALGTNERGKPSRKPRLAISAEITSRGNLSVVIRPFRDENDVCDFLPTLFGGYVPPGFNRPKGEAVFLRDVEGLFQRTERDPPLESLTSDIRAMVVIGFENLVAQISKKFEVIRLDTIQPIMTGKGMVESVASLQIKTWEDLEREAEEKARSERRDHLANLQVDPIALGHATLVPGNPPLREKDIIAAFRLAGIPSNGMRLNSDCDRLKLALEENLPGWRTAAFKPLPPPLDGGRQKPGPKPRLKPAESHATPKIERQAKPMVERSFNVVGLMTRVNKLREGRGEAPVKRKDWPLSARAAKAYIEEVSAAHPTGRKP